MCLGLGGAFASSVHTCSPPLPIPSHSSERCMNQLHTSPTTSLADFTALIAFWTGYLAPGPAGRGRAGAAMVIHDVSYAPMRFEGLRRAGTALRLHDLYQDKVREAYRALSALFRG